MRSERRLQEVSEAPAFIRKAEKLWSQDEYEAFIAYIAENPNAGDLIEGTGGARKIRWSGSGRGKRGGTRVITYYHDETLPVYLLMLFTKNERADLGPEDKRELHEIIAAIKARHRQRKLS
jgi:mRNA-degrading endonuclease RelE of RelBE toxin-antitoxin system